MNNAESNIRRYFQLAVITLAAGAIFPLLYLRQNFEVPILETFGLTLTQLGECYSALGFIFVATFLPSGWLADRVSTRVLMSFSLLLAGLLGLYFMTIPSFTHVQLIFAGWGIATGLTFWGALIKSVAVIAHHDEQGRFFGILDSGRGLVEAILASIAIAWFAWSMDSLGNDTEIALQQVILIYSVVMLVLCPVIYFVLDDQLGDEVDPEDLTAAESSAFSKSDMRLVFGNKKLWMASFCLLCGYQLFWATYSFSGYLQNFFGMTAVTAGVITVAKLWMRPIGGVVAGFVGDRYGIENILGWLMLLSSIALVGMTIMPVGIAMTGLLVIVLTVGLLTYAIKGLYLATLDDCGVPDRIKGLAVGLMSFVGFAPDFYLPLLNGYLVDGFEGRTGYTLYFGFISVMGVLGALAAWKLQRMHKNEKNNA